MKHTLSTDQLAKGPLSDGGLQEAPIEIWKRPWVEAGFITAFWLLIILITIGQRANDPRGPEGLAWQELVLTILQFTLWGLLTPAFSGLAARLISPGPTGPGESSNIWASR